MQDVPSLHRHFVRCSVSVAVVVCSARFGHAEQQGAPADDLPASHKNNARSWLVPAHWPVTRRGLAHATLGDKTIAVGGRFVAEIPPPSAASLKDNDFGQPPLVKFLENVHKFRKFV